MVTVKSLAKLQTYALQAYAGEMYMADSPNNLLRKVDVDSIFTRNVWAIEI